jgi:heme/copper-type cytochrome/quinol oxidase subunit 2
VPLSRCRWLFISSDVDVAPARYEVRSGGIVELNGSFSRFRTLLRMLPAVQQAYCATRSHMIEQHARRYEFAFNSFPGSGAPREGLLVTTRWGPAAGITTCGQATFGSVAASSVASSLEIMKVCAVPVVRAACALRGRLFLVPLAAVAAAGSACGGAASPSANNGTQAATETSALPFPDTGSRLGAAPGAQVITFTVVGAEQGAFGPDGRRHDTFRATSSTTVVAGRAVTVEIENHDEMPHSFTLPELGIDRLVPAADHGQAGKVTFTFTPHTAGTYRWYCALPCDQDNNYWAMGMYAPGSPRMGGMGGRMMEPGVDGFMAGYITVT